MFSKLKKALMLNKKCIAKKILLKSINHFIMNIARTPPSGALYDRYMNYSMAHLYDD